MKKTFCLAMLAVALMLTLVGTVFAEMKGDIVIKASLGRMQQMPSFCTIKKGTHTIVEGWYSSRSEKSRVTGHDSDLAHRRAYKAQAWLEENGVVVTSVVTRGGNSGERGVVIRIDETHYRIRRVESLAKKNAADIKKNAEAIEAEKATRKYADFIQDSEIDILDTRVSELEDRSAVNLRIFAGGRSWLFNCEEKNLYHGEISATITAVKEFDGWDLEYGIYGAISGAVNSLSRVNTYSFTAGGGLYIKPGPMFARVGVSGGQKVNNLTDEALIYYNPMFDFQVGASFSVIGSVLVEPFAGAALCSIDTPGREDRTMCLTFGIRFGL